MASTVASMRVAVTPRSISEHGHPALERLVEHGLEPVFPAPGRTPTQDELLAVVPGCVGYLAGVEPINRELLRNCPQLRVIARNGVGVNSIDLAAADEFGIAVERAPGANAQGVAELAMALIFAGQRHLPWSDSHLKAGEWRRRQGVELAGRTLGIVGLGQIGRRVAAMATGIGMSVIGYDAYPERTWQPPARFRWGGLGEVFTVSDVVTLHAPASGQPLVDRATLAMLPPGAALVNTARAELVDESAVLSALESGHLSTYAIDAFVTEPPTDLRLARHERVIATPHIGGYTVESVDRATSIAVDHILAALHAAPAS